MRTVWRPDVSRGTFRPMAFVPIGKKKAKAKPRPISEDDMDLIIDGAVGAVHHVMPHPGLCLPQCVLLGRMLGELLPHRRFDLRLGSLVLHPQRGDVEPITFDPRGPGGIDDGFHAWLEDADGVLLDSSMCITLNAEGYDVPPDQYFSCVGRTIPFDDFVLVYEELPDLQLLGLHESQVMLDHLYRAATLGTPMPHGQVMLDIGWKGGKPPTAS